MSFSKRDAVSCSVWGNHIATICVSVIFLLIGVTQASASPRDFDKARAIAIQKAKSLGKTISQETVVHAKAKATNNSSSTTEATPYYIFNFDDSAGYAIVSGYDEMPAIIGYSSEGSLDEDYLPDNIKGLLQAYQATVEAVQDGDETATKNVNARMARAAGTVTAVEPLLGGIAWKQDAPYNRLCPGSSDASHSNPGTVALAMAQIMRYWKYPSALQADIDSYDCYFLSGDSFITKTCGGIQKGVVYEWDNMLESYAGDYTEQQANAVATLIYHCGTSVRTQYPVGSFGDLFYASYADVPNALVKNFGYDGDLIQYIERSLFEWDEWNDILQRELAAKRPIFYTGLFAEFPLGDAFVCDGVDADGYYHINWGSGIGSSGYFDITILDQSNPKGSTKVSDFTHNRNNAIVIGIMPDNGVKDTPLVAYDKFIINSSSAVFSKTKRSDASENFVGTSTYVLQNTTTETHKALFAVGIKNADGDFTPVSSTQEVEITPEQQYASIENSIDYAFPTGVYALYGIESKDGGETWEVCYNNQSNKILLYVEEQTIGSSVDIPSEAIVVDGLKYEISQQTLEATLVANDYTGNIVIPQEIKYGVFTFPVTTLGRECFVRCSSVTSVSIPEGVKKIRRSCFSSCSRLTEIVIPESVTTLEGGAFCDCSSLNTVQLPSGITELGDATFRFCSSLKSIKVPDGVTSIEGYCFDGCTSLESIELPEGLKTVNGAFQRCSALKNINLPKSLTRLDGDCFVHCTSLESIKIPEGVTGLDRMCFGSCTSLQTVDLPSTITNLGEYCFCETSKMSKFICRAASVPEIADGCFSQVRSFAVLYVPANAVSEYKVAEGWKKFRTILPLSETGINQPSADGLRVTVSGGMVEMTGLAPDTLVGLYTLDGKFLSSGMADSHGALSLQAIGDIVIAKIGKDSVKIILK